MVNRCTLATCRKPIPADINMDEPIPPLTNLGAFYRAETKIKFSRPVILTRIPAGFPSPAEPYLAGRLDLNQQVVRHPTSTFFVKVEGDSMIGEHIFDGDILVVDRAEEARHGSIVIARIGQEHCVKKLCIQGNRVWLASANPAYANIEITDDTDWEIWGCVTHSLRKH